MAAAQDAGAAPSAESADALRAEGNENFKAKHFALAVMLYTRAIEADPSVAASYGNRAFAHIKLENYGAAVADAEAALRLDPNYVKAYYRRGEANFCLRKLKEALRDFRQVAKSRPNDPDARRKLKECEAAVNAIRFQEAIATPEDNRSVAETIDLNNYSVDSSYKGPRLEEGDVVSLPFIRAMMDHFKDGGKLAVRYALAILLQVKAVLEALPTIQEVDVAAGAHLTVCGDVHGQYYDLLNVFELNGLPSPENPYLFNGDFVDRGSWSAEVVLTLFAFKVLYPGAMHLQRGNHETKAMNTVYGFDGEVRAKLNETASKLFAEVFCCLPLGAVLGGKVFVVHGGLFSRDDVTLDELKAINRFREPPDEGPFCEMLWSDPVPGLGRSPSKRGVGVAFGADVTKSFLERNGLQLLVRSHEVKDEGFEVEHGGCCITVFSAPNYCDQMGNKGAFIRFESDMVPHMTSYQAVPHPAVRPMAYASSFMSHFS